MFVGRELSRMSMDSLYSRQEDSIKRNLMITKIKTKHILKICANIALKGLLNFAGKKVLKVRNKI